MFDLLHLSYSFFYMTLYPIYFELVVGRSPFTFLAAQINTKLCDKFSVDHYPMLFWAPSKFVSGGWEPKQEKNEIHVIDDARTADRLINWINKQTVRYGVFTSISCLKIIILLHYMFYLEQV